MLRKVREIEIETNKNIEMLRKISKEISKEFGTEILIGFDSLSVSDWFENRVEDFDKKLNLLVKVPRINGKGYFVELKDDLRPSTPRLEEIVLKMRAVEKLINEKYDNYEDEIYISLIVDDFLEKSVEEIFSEWGKNFTEWVDYFNVNDDDEDDDEDDEEDNEEDNDDEDEYDV